MKPNDATKEAGQELGLGLTFRPPLTVVLELEEWARSSSACSVTLPSGVPQQKGGPPSKGASKTSCGEWS